MAPATETAFALAKISRPRSNRPVLRPRLFQRLDALRSAAIVWVCGPPGAGKSTLASSYLAERGLASLWYQLDADDADAARFFYYLGLALQQSQAGSSLVLPSLMPEMLPGLMGFTRRYADILAAHLQRPALIVLDNYELLPADAVLHMVLRELAAALPQGLVLLVLSRTLPPAAYARMRLHEDLVLLEGLELNLARDEAASLAAVRTGGVPDAARIDQLLADTQGWCAGFNLLLADTRTADQHSAGLQSQQLLFDYFATELFERFGPAQQHALLCTALLPCMTVAHAQHLSGFTAIGALLADLHRQNCFCVQRGQQEPVYEFHALFRSFLLSRATTQIPASAWHRLQCQAADLLAQARQVDAAADGYRAAAHWPGLVALALQEALALVAAGRHHTLEHWLAALPSAVFQHHPWLCHWQATARLPFDPAAARGLFAQAYAGFQAQDDAEGLYATWAGAMESFFFEWRDFRPADRWIAEWERLRMRHPAFPSRAVELRTYWAMGTLLHRQPQHPLLPAWSERALALLAPGDRDLSVLIGGYLVIYFLWRGETSQAWGVVERIAPWTTPDMSPMVHILWCCAVGLYHSVRGETQACQTAIEDGLAVAQRTELHAFDFLLSAQLARCHLVTGDLAQADIWMGRMAASMHSHSHIDGAFYQHLQCNAAVQRGDWQQAVDYARAAMAMGQESGVPMFAAHCHIDLARALVGHGDRSEWPQHLAAARAIGHAMHSQVVHYLCLEAEATAALQQDAPDHLAQALRQALAASRTMDGATWQMAGPQARARLYDQALAWGIEVDHVQRLVRRHRLSPPEAATAADAWPWPVRIYTLGRFDILRDDQPLRSAGKAQRKPLELLKCLCAFGGQAVNQDRVTDALWPDTDGDAADQALRTTLHRLRKLLQHDTAVRLEDRHLHLDPHQVWADCLVLDRMAHHPGMADMAHLQRAVARYRGPFLHGESAPWALACRERLRAHFSSMAERLGGLLEQQGDWPGAAHCYLHAIEVEPGAEGFYRSLMHCYARTGRRAEALAVYQRCRQSLLTRLGTSPGQATQALYMELNQPS